MKYTPNPIEPPSQEAIVRTFKGIIEGFERFGQTINADQVSYGNGNHYQIYADLTALLQDLCDPDNPFTEISAVDLLTTTYYRYSLNGVLIPHNPNHAKVMSNTKFAALMANVIELNANTDAQGLARALAWRSFLEDMIGRIRYSLPNVRVLEFPSGDTTIAVSVDDMAHRSLEILEGNLSHNPTASRLSLLTDFVQKISNGSWSTHWNEFAANLPEHIRTLVTEELFRLVSNAFLTPFKKA